MLRESDIKVIAKPIDFCRYTYYCQLLLDERLDSSLAPDDKPYIHEILFEIIAANHRETEVIYRRGLLDGIWLLKNLTALS